MSEKKLVVAVVGATGAVGREMLKTLESRNFPATEVVPFASARSAGTKVPYGDSELVVRELKEDVFEGIDIAIFSAGGSTSEKYAPHAAAAGCIVVDNSSAWRMDERCPLVVPEVNVYPHRIAFNCIPHIDVFLENDYTKEEMKMVHETVKIMGDPNVKVTATCVRVPVFYGHSESVNIETERKLSAKEARAILAQAPGVQVYDNPSEKMYPLAVDAAGEDATYVGRIREDDTIPNGLNMWIVADNIRKGAALNAVQIAEELVRRDLLGVKDRTVFIKK